MFPRRWQVLPLLCTRLDHWLSQGFRAELLSLIFFVGLVFIMPRHVFDWGSFVQWALYMRQDGFANVYQHWVNYMPLNLYPIQLWQLVLGWLQLDLVREVHWLKLYPLFFDWATVLLLLRWAKHYRLSVGLTLLCFLPNIGFHANGFFWGQFDGVYTFFVLVSALLIIAKRPTWALLAFVLALNAKLQAIIFWPVLITFVWLHIFADQPQRWRQVAKTVVTSSLLGFGMTAILFSPFTGTELGQSLQLIWSRSVEMASWVTFNADNWWILMGVKSMDTVVTEPWLFGWSYHWWGYILYGSLMIVTLGPALMVILRQWWPTRLPKRLAPLLPSPRQLSPTVMTEWLLWSLYLQALGFFFFLTLMHERYSHPAVVFAGVLAVLTRRLDILFLTSLAYFLNIEWVGGYFHPWLNLAAWSEVSMVAATLYLLALGIAIIRLYTFFYRTFYHRASQSR